MIGSNQFPEQFAIGSLSSNYFILVAVSGYRVVAEFMFVDIPDGKEDCSKNKISVRDGHSPRSPLLALLCGPTDKVQYSSSGMFMRVDMSTTPTQRTRGFLAKAWLVQE